MTNSKELRRAAQKKVKALRAELATAPKNDVIGQILGTVAYDIRDDFVVEKELAAAIEEAGAVERLIACRGDKARRVWNAINNPFDT